MEILINLPLQESQHGEGIVYCCSTLIQLNWTTLCNCLLWPVASHFIRIYKLRPSILLLPFIRILPHLLFLSRIIENGPSTMHLSAAL